MTEFDNSNTPSNDMVSGNIHIRELQRDQIFSWFKLDVDDLGKFDAMSLYNLEVKLELVDRQWNNFENVQMQLEVLDESQFTQHHRSKCEEAYLKVKSRILELIALHRPTGPDHLLSSTRLISTNSTAQPHLPRINLPTLQLTKFGGQQRDWLDFYNTFCVLVDNNSDLSDITKFQYLRSCLLDSASRLIQSLEVTSVNYKKALEILISRYDNKIEIFQSHMQHIFELQKIKQPSVSSIREFIDTITVDLRALESIATKSQVADGIILHMITSKLDVDTQAKWEEEASSSLVKGTSSSTLQLPTWETLSAFLEKRCKTLSIINNNQAYKSFNRNVSSKNNHVSSLVAANEQTTCIICKSPHNHSAYRCTKFIEMAPHERFVVVKRHKLCLNCLNPNHIATSCPSQNRCRQCNAPHHTLLHRDPSQQPSQTNNTHHPPPRQSHPDPTDQIPSVSLQVAREKSLVILATALVELSNQNGVSIVGRALLDSCSQQNFLTKHIAQHLKPSYNKINMKISGLGNNLVSAHQSCSITIKSLSTAFSAEVDAVVIPCISSRHPQKAIDTSDWKIPENINLADNNFNIPGPIDLLLGADIFWDLLMVGRIKLHNQPNFIKTKLGWVVTGSAVMTNSLQTTSLTAANIQISKTDMLSLSSNAQQMFLTVPNHLNRDVNKTLTSTDERDTLAAFNNIPLSTSSSKTVSYPKQQSTSSSNSPSSTNIMTSHSSNFICLQSVAAGAKQTITTKQRSYMKKTKYTSFIAASKEPLIEELLKKFWEMENQTTLVTSTLTAEEAKCETLFKETTKLCPISNKFIVRLPFKEDPKVLGESYDIACRRFSYLESKLNRNEDIKNQYVDFMEQYQRLNHMSPVLNGEELFCNFIPHHCVVKPENTTTRLRVVFDASCATTSGKSLNDVLCVGPVLQDHIFATLSRFRYHKYVLVADIAKMYRQVWVDKIDTKWQCILWRTGPTEPLTAYRLETLTYGTSCAPYLAVKCLQKIAHDYANIYPIGSKVVLNDFYVDNLMTGSETAEGAIDIKAQVTNLLNCGGFPLRKFATNFEPILEGVPNEDKEELVQIDDTQYMKTLGLRWSPQDDTISFAYTPPNDKRRVTMRSILSHTAAFYDPLGLINPIIVKAKILYQSLWILKLHWDESVPQEVVSEFEYIRDQLKKLCPLKIERFVLFNNTTNIHVFADASTKAYGACIYAVSIGPNGVKSSLICAKSRVAPTQTVSLPRLELCAALLGAQLLETVRTTFPQKPQRIFCWSDSTVALAWIAGSPSRWPTFVSNRVTKIQELTEDVIWRHVPTDKNPADLLSRGSSVDGLINTTFWFEGPSFLQSDESMWPTNICTEEEGIVECEIPQVTLIAVQTYDVLQSHKYVNSYEKLLRILAYVNRFITASRSKMKVLHNPITTEEIDNALIVACKIVQHSCFIEELKQLESNKPVSKSSKLRKLAPILMDGLIRVGGRLKNSSLQFSEKHPIVLPGGHPFVQTLITYHHIKHLHASTLSLHYILRERFWIINGRNIIRANIHSCVLCYRHRPKLEEQVMGNLPKERVEPGFPFKTCGVDYCGPFAITQKIRGRSPIKAYICLFICFSTKAVHMELVPDLTTAAFIAALKRFIARRGRCTTIFSDNATNFVGANRELKSLLAHFLSEQHVEDVRLACQQDGISWKFIPPRSPHFGGLWESAVKQAKYLLCRAIGTYILTHDELHTITCQAEAIINSRPLTPISSDPNDLRPLTPAHFLVGRPLTDIPEPDVRNMNPWGLKNYKLTQWIQQTFWNRWRKEYLNNLQQRNKWSSQSPNIMINDMVLLKDDNIPPLKWPLGRVIEVNPGADGAVRVATIRSTEGTFKRAVTKLCKLPIDCN